jgi:hypothetical protein
MAVASYQTSPVFVPGFLSGGQVRTVQENTGYLYDTFRAYPLHGTYHGATDQVLYINYPQGAFYPIWGGGFVKTAGRDELLVQFAYQNAGVGYEHRADVYLYDQDGTPTLLEQISMTATSLTTVTRTYSLNSIAAGEGYYVIIFAGRTGTERITAGSGYPTAWHRIQIDQVVGRRPGGAARSGFPTLPTFAGDNDFIKTPAKLQALCTATDWLYESLTLFGRPGYAAVLQRPLDTQAALVQRVHHATVPLAPGRDQIRIRGRFEGVNSQRMSVSVGGVERWAQTYSNAVRTITNPWTIPISTSGLSLVSGNLARLGIDYQRIGDARRPRPRMSIVKIAAIGSHTSASWQAMTPFTALTDYATPAVQAELDRIATNLAAAKSQLDQVAFYLDTDRPLAWPWDTGQRYAYHPQGDVNAIKRTAENRLAPASFTRAGDILEVWGVNLRIVWGIPVFDLEDKEPATYTAMYEYPISSNPEAIEQRTVYLSGVRDKSGMPLSRGMDYWVIGDRLYDARERLAFGVV